MNDDVLEFADLFIILVEKSNIQTKVFVDYLVETMGKLNLV